MLTGISEAVRYDVPLLGQAVEQEDVVEGFIWFGVVIGAVMLLAVFFAYVRKRMRSAPTAPVETFTLAQLRQLHQNGDLTDAEFDRLKAQLMRNM